MTIDLFFFNSSKASQLLAWRLNFSLIAYDCWNYYHNCQWGYAQQKKYYIDKCMSISRTINFGLKLNITTSITGKKSCPSRPPTKSTLMFSSKIRTRVPDTRTNKWVSKYYQKQSIRYCYWYYEWFFHSGKISLLVRSDWSNIFAYRIMITKVLDLARRQHKISWWLVQHKRHYLERSLFSEITKHTFNKPHHESQYLITKWHCRLSLHL